jgi:hypothetical protein
MSGDVENRCPKREGFDLILMPDAVGSSLTYTGVPEPPARDPGSARREDGVAEVGELPDFPESITHVRISPTRPSPTLPRPPGLPIVNALSLGRTVVVDRTRRSHWATHGRLPPELVRRSSARSPMIATRSTVSDTRAG